MNSTMAGVILKDILIVDDDDVMREKYRRILRTGPYQIREATSGSEARNILETTEFDCILLDYRLGDANGTDLMPIINNLNRRPCPVIMITSSDNDRLIVEAMRNGVYDYIKKGDLDVDHLASVITAGLRWAELEKQLRASQEKLNYLSLYDGLTGLPNRNLFFDRLEQVRLHAIRDKTCFALMMMDLDLFKQVNDTYGHLVGDALLKQVGERFQKVTRETSTYARLGGDEFAGLFPHVKTKEAAIIVAKKVIDAINAAYFISGHNLKIGISIGIALFPSDDTDVQALLAKADIAMYNAKVGCLGFDVHDSKKQINNNVLTKSISIHLADAIKHNEFTMHYQPQISLVDGTCCGVEALARWHSPVLGTIPPIEFISVAERSSIIVELSYLLFDLAIAQAGEWHRHGINLPVSVNMSAKLLDVEDLVITISQLLQQHQVSPELLTVEITETALSENPEHATKVINDLVNMGVQISIDDFGTGYTSFTYLRECMFSELKIDKLFIMALEKNTQDAAIVKSFISLSQGLNTGLVAEGVEDLERLVLLKEWGCSHAQGYYISKPFTSDKLPSWLKSWEHRVPEIFGDKPPNSM